MEKNNDYINYADISDSDSYFYNLENEYNDINPFKDIFDDIHFLDFITTLPSIFDTIGIYLYIIFFIISFIHLLCHLLSLYYKIKSIIEKCPIFIFHLYNIKDSLRNLFNIIKKYKNL